MGQVESGGGLTPMMEQYQRLRRGLPADVLLFFRLGDFYELFFEDARSAAGLLDVALTKRNGVPMCGVPHHALRAYMAKLIKAGKRVAIAEQTSEPKPGRIVEREISQVVSAGTVDDFALLDSNRQNYLAAVCESRGRFGLACLDHTTGEFRLTECPDLAALEDELSRVAPSELIFPEGRRETFGRLRHALAADDYAFLEEHATPALEEHFGVHSLDGLGCRGLGPALGAAGAILHYLRHQLHRDVGHVRKLRVYRAEQYVVVDAATQQNLDLIESRGGPRHCLLGALDRTATAMGGRKLRHWILHPLRDLAPLVARQDLIGALLAEPFLLERIREGLREVRDIERTLARLSQGSGNARDLQALARSFQAVPDLREHLGALAAGRGLLADQLHPRLRGFEDLVDELERALVDEPPATVREGGVFREGYRAELDELRAASSQGRQWIADLQAAEIERTGIKSLKIKYNAVFGYFIEVTKANLANVPADYTRKQTTANAERFVTPALKEMENRVLGADERARALELEEFHGLRGRIVARLEEIQDTADALGTLDVLAGLAETARLFDYTRPVLGVSRSLRIDAGRHPVLDQNIAGEKFVPNDTLIDPDEQRLLIITGPNMAGKSTYIRQVALLTLMAQIGSFIPAASAEIGLVDRIFTRVGASDDLSRGQSTFMVEMNETALIVNNATGQSLVVLDEVGRGTATFDGLSIAWSVAEYLHDVIGARALFATHYHELTALAASRPAVKNFNIAVREQGERIVFLRRIVPGPADKSYGIQVARLAGLPQEIIDRSKEILARLEANALRPGGEPARRPPKTAPAAPPPRGTKPKLPAGEPPEAGSPQLSLFS